MGIVQIKNDDVTNELEIDKPEQNFCKKKRKLNNN